MSDEKHIEDVLEFWIGDAADDPAAVNDANRRWFSSSKSLDNTIREQFGEQVEAALSGELDRWAESPRGCVALIILLDQFARNLHRGTSRAFAGDSRSLAITEKLLADDGLAQLKPAEQVFACMPLQHAEDRAVQARSVEVFWEIAGAVSPQWREYMQGSAKYADIHRDIVEKFGRFPHRNRVLNRENTPEEAEYLADGAPSFGQG